MTTTRSVILAGARTPFAKLNGALATKTAVELGGIAIRCAMERAGVRAEDVDHVAMGQVLQGGAGQIPSRQAAFLAGLDKTVTSETVNRVCGSGMRAVTLADDLLRLGEHEVVVAGGMESMTNAPYLLRKARGGYRMGDGVLEDMMVGDGLTCAVAGVHMGVHGGNVAAEEGVGREEQDAWALRSHERYFASKAKDAPAEEIVPVTVHQRKGDAVVDRDEAPRRDTSLEALAGLKPVFDPRGTVTAGNAPGVNDGAAALVLASEGWARERGLTPAATVLAHGAAAWDVPYLAYTPEMAARVALRKAGLAVEDIALWEINEAFASVPIISARRLGVDPERVNVNGGAIALGHPIGASGARIVLALVNELRRRGGGLGVAAICSGGGQGDAIVVEVGRK
jgi:acetyl-CoA C-acetyltransferase